MIKNNAKTNFRKCSSTKIMFRFLLNLIYRFLSFIYTDLSFLVEPGEQNSSITNLIFFVKDKFGRNIPFMKIVQTFWSRPIVDRMSTSYNGGWLEKKYNYMSLSLSCLLLKRLYGQVELVTDDEGKHILIDVLRLPYSTIKVELNKLSGYNNNLTCAAKFYTYSIQKEPFIHVDGDFFLYEKPDRGIERYPCVVANEIDFYPPAFDRFLDYMESLQMAAEEVARGYNPGFFGGNAPTYIAGFAKGCLDLFDKNLDFINKNIDFATGDSVVAQEGVHPFAYVNMIIESYFFHSFAKGHGIKVGRAFEHQDAGSSGNGAMLGIGPRVKYRQPMYDKRRPSVCLQLEYQLRKRYPEQYHTILSAIKEYKF